MPVGRGPLLIPGPFALRRRLSRASALASLLWVAVAVGLAVLPRARPVTGSSFNYTGPVLAASVAAILLWWVWNPLQPKKWMPQSSALHLTLRAHLDGLLHVAASIGC